MWAKVKAFFSSVDAALVKEIDRDLETAESELAKLKADVNGALLMLEKRVTELEALVVPKVTK